ncbi:hypothetical protein [Endozoicomonas sp. 8E]|uniref:hypothetical protein n=1 Tax=Endozoicomonas sp. 8E TaxID=3035692 RepID=UPI002938D0F8|nr:hypothetical protein [Endozoicomonas sp. 8E]WOG29640.1 hypothetical protein P6910_08295 [Endozoicomonas sp. 8E]
MKLLLSLCIVTLITIPSAESSPALPTIPTSQTTAAPSDLKLYELCSGNIKNQDLLSTEAMKQATVKALEQVLTRSAQPIDRCIIKTPTKGNYLDESINGFNTSKSREETANTAFLLVGVGIKSEPFRAGEDCASTKPVIAGKQRDQSSVLPGNWLEQFQLRKTIHLKSGQMLIGVPLDSSNGAFAEGYFAGLKREIDPAHNCSKHLSNLRSILHKGEMIHFSGTNILINGLTTLPAFTNTYQSDLETKTLCYRGWLNTHKAASSHEMHTEMLKGELDLRSLEVPDNGYMVNIFGNELFQILQPAVSISLADQSEDVDSRLFNNRTLIGFSNNQVYSCYPGQVETAVNINIAYQDASPESGFIQALEFKDNHILGNAPQAIKIVLPEQVKASINNNQFVATKVSDRDTKGTSPDGPDQSSKNWPASLTLNVTGNLIKGYQAALSLAGHQKLVLYPDPSSDSKPTSSSPSILTEIQPAFSNATERAYFEFSADKESNNLKDPKGWPITMICIGGVSIAILGIISGYIKHKIRNSFRAMIAAEMIMSEPKSEF